ncbi:uncharacterized protein PAC_04015 [Phialocephala subalpina]|uniref:Azaphilone pigments biosynthesis cluster protein L N-terminal domain-containing protein n=1 Tax=Phialocephala subalpina TaxID=576137 RepID=A0A1L7WMY4_9HELO|nr:uncharacterized protein PAC_04015 [Phialocephala subalpina]
MDAITSLLAITGLVYSSSKALADLSALQTDLTSLEATLKEANSTTLAPVLQRVGITDALNACSKICSGFMGTIGKYSKHSTTDGFSKRDRLTVAFRNTKIEAFTTRLNVAKARLNLQKMRRATTATNYKGTEGLKDMLEKQEEALKSQSAKPTTIENDMKDLVISPSAEDPDNDIIPITSEESDLTLSILPVLKQTCKEALAVTTQVRTKQVFGGKMITDKDARAVEGVVGKPQGNVDQTFKGDVITKDGSEAVRGQMYAESFKVMWARSLRVPDDGSEKGK